MLIYSNSQFIRRSRVAKYKTLLVSSNGHAHVFSLILVHPAPDLEMALSYKATEGERELIACTVGNDFKVVKVTYIQFI